MTYEEAKYKILGLRYRLCQMCLGDDNAQYKKSCRRPGEKHDCKVQARVDELEVEVLKDKTPEKD